MAENSNIEWTDATWNPITGCSIKSPGCARCYAMKLAGTRLRNHPSRKGLTKIVNGNIVWTGEVRFNEMWLTQPLGWKKPSMVFVCAHGDLFHEDVPDEWIDRVFAVMLLASWHTFQVLTKRSERMRTYMANVEREARWMNAVAALFERYPETQRRPYPIIGRTDPWLPAPNVWLGVSAERQLEAEERIPDLLATPAAVRFVSLEPLLGPIDLTTLRGKPMDFDGAPRRAHWINALTGEHGNFILGMCKAILTDRLSALDWIIVGGESGKLARPMHPDWARSLRDQCAAAGKLDRFFFKQWGQYGVCPSDQHRDKEHIFLARDWDFVNLGKKTAGRFLDGIEHNGMPEARTP